MTEVIVLDPGSSSFKAGFSGQDLPQSIFPSIVGGKQVRKSRRAEVSSSSSSSSSSSW